MEPQAFPWQQALAMAINGVGVMAAVWLFNYLLPYVRESAPWLIPIIAGSAGPAIAAIQGFLAGWLGLPIDLSPLLAVFSGGTAVAIHQVYKNAKA